MKNKLCYLLLAVAVLGAVTAAAVGYRSAAALQTSRALVVQTLLEPAVALLAQNQTLLKELQSGPATDAGPSVLDTYLARIRKEGVPAHAAARKRLDQIAENQLAIATLLTAYGPHARTPALEASVEQFRAHASAWRSRWSSVMEVFMAGGHFPTAELPFPAQLGDRLGEELKAAR